MYEGGRVAIADDFGAGQSLLDGFRIERSAATGRRALRLRGNRNLLIATPGARHPLALDVRALVTNHPQVLHHGELEAIFSLSRRARRARSCSPAPSARGGWSRSATAAC